MPTRPNHPNFITDYETIAASQTAQVLGPVGATGDMLTRIIIVPAAVGAGLVTILDNAISINVFATGTLSDLTPIVIEVGARSVSGSWRVTTGANVSVLAIGSFT